MTAKDHDRVPRSLAYRTTREHISELALTRGAAGVRVPACPEWTVRDLVAHVAGHCARRIGETIGDEDVAELIGIWRRAGQEVERRIAEGTEDVQLMMMDTFAHELDLRAALGVAPPPDHPAYPWAFDVVTGGLDWSIAGRGLPAVRLIGDGSSWIAGQGAPAATVTATRYDLYRSMTGRRTMVQIGQLDWSEDPGQWLPAFFWGPFSEPALPGD